jgi:hypothetical protein
MTKATIAFKDDSYMLALPEDLKNINNLGEEMFFRANLTRSYLEHLTHRKPMLPEIFLEMVSLPTDEHEVKEAPGAVVIENAPTPSKAPLIEPSNVRVVIDLEGHGGIKNGEHVSGVFKPGELGYPLRSELDSYINSGKIIDLQDGRLCFPTGAILSTLKEELEKLSPNSIDIIWKSCKSNEWLDGLPEDRIKGILPVNAALAVITSEPTGFHNQQLLRMFGKFIKEHRLNYNPAAAYIYAALKTSAVPIRVKAIRHVEGESESYIQEATALTQEDDNTTYQSLSNIAEKLGLDPWRNLAACIVENNIAGFIQQFDIMLKEIFDSLGYELIYDGMANSEQDRELTFKDFLLKTDFTSSSDSLQASSMIFERYLKEFLNGKITENDRKIFTENVDNLTRELRAHLSPYYFWDFFLENNSYFQVKKDGKIVTDSIITPLSSSSSDDEQQEDLQRRVTESFKEQQKKESTNKIKKLFMKALTAGQPPKDAERALPASKIVSRRTSKRGPVMLISQAVGPLDVAFCPWFSEPLGGPSKEAQRMYFFHLFPNAKDIEEDNWQIDYVTAIALKYYFSTQQHFPNFVFESKNLAKHIVALHNLGHEGLVIELLNKCKTNPGTLITSLRNQIPALLLKEPKRVLNGLVRGYLLRDETDFLYTFFSYYNRFGPLAEIIGNTEEVSIKRSAFDSFSLASNLRDDVQDFASKTLAELFTDEFKAQLGIGLITASAAPEASEAPAARAR